MVFLRCCFRARTRELYIASTGTPVRRQFDRWKGKRRAGADADERRQISTA
jgi:hypothetical protein